MSLYVFDHVCRLHFNKSKLKTPNKDSLQNAGHPDFRPSKGCSSTEPPENYFERFKGHALRFAK